MLHPRVQHQSPSDYGLRLLFRLFFRDLSACRLEGAHPVAAPLLRSVEGPIGLRQQGLRVGGVRPKSGHAEADREREIDVGERLERLAGRLAQALGRERRTLDVLAGRKTTNSSPP